MLVVDGGAGSSWHCWEWAMLLRDPPLQESSRGWTQQITGVLCLWSVFLVLSWEASLPLGSKFSLKRGRNLVFAFLRCCIPVNYTTGTKLSTTLNHLSLQKKGFGWINLPKRCLWGTFRFISLWGACILLPWLKANTEDHQNEWFLNINFHLQHLTRLGKANLGLEIRW